MVLNNHNCGKIEKKDEDKLLKDEDKRVLNSYEYFFNLCLKSIWM